MQASYGREATGFHVSSTGETGSDALQEPVPISSEATCSSPTRTGADVLNTLYDDVDLYDCMVWGHCETFYFDAASCCGGPILEMACGTGRMLAPMAAAGLDVTGIDLSPVMLTGALARARHLGTTLRLVQGNMGAFRFSQPFALIFVAVNSLLHLTSTQALRSCFASVRRALRPDGRFVFDICNFAPAYLVGPPDQRHPVGRYMSAVHGPLLIEELRRYDATTQMLHRTWFHSATRRPDFRVVEFAMRVIYPEELQVLLEVEGLQLETRFGDLGRSPFRSESPSQVCVVRHA